MRSKPIVASVINQCFSSNTDFIQWNLYKLDSNGTATLDAENMAHNPTVNKPDVYIRPKLLAYGIYKLSATLVQFHQENSFECNNTCNDTADYIFQVIATPLAIFGLENGVKQMTIGQNQNLTLNPGSFSIDSDSLLTSPNLLDFKYYSRVLNTVTGVQAQFSSFDLLQVQSNLSLSFDPSQVGFLARCKKKR